MTDTAQLRAVGIFYVIALALALVLALNAGALGESVLLLTMFTPVVAVIVVKLVVTPNGWLPAGWKDLGLHRPGFRLWPAAVLLALGVILPGYLIVWATGPGQFSGSLAPEAMAQAIVKFTISLLIGASLGALGEETGWRGFMLPRLLFLGRMRASLLVGFLHGVWHLPLVLLTPFYHSSGVWWITVPLFLTALTLGGAVYGWLRLASASVWPVALAHRALNLTWDRLDAATTTDQAVTVDHVAGETGIVPILVLLVMTLLVARYWRGHKSAMEGA